MNDNINFKKSMFNIFMGLGDKFLLYNTLTEAIIMMTNEEKSRVENFFKLEPTNDIISAKEFLSNDELENLKIGGFIVSKKSDEYNKLKTEVKMSQFVDLDTYSITIAPNLWKGNPFLDKILLNTDFV